MPERARYFTLHEANALIPALAATMRTINDKIRVARELYQGDSPDRDRIEAVKAEIEALVDRVRDDGVEVKGLEPALLDFPALRHGTEVYLCWREGETEISHWHPTTTGFSGRQRLDARDVWEYDN